MGLRGITSMFVDGMQSTRQAYASLPATDEPLAVDPNVREAVGAVKDAVSSAAGQGQALGQGQGRGDRARARVTGPGPG